jgi:hypothetical protein
MELTNTVAHAIRARFFIWSTPLLVCVPVGFKTPCNMTIEAEMVQRVMVYAMIRVSSLMPVDNFRVAQAGS